MLEFLYNLIINPLVQIESLFYSIIYKFTGNHIVSIICLSILINTLTLPLYLRADELQNAEREKQKSMKKWVDHIKRHFKGDERFFMLSAYYKINHYKPIYALKSSLSLLLQIPFFTAAYQFFTKTSFLVNQKAIEVGDILFGNICVSGGYLFKNLGLPDNTFFIGKFPINVLPILMTIINLASALIYTRGFSFKEKSQTLILPLIFLILLYNSPSGLVFYWICNNIYSLCKNILLRLVLNNNRLITLFQNRKQNLISHRMHLRAIFDYENNNYFSANISRLIIISFIVLFTLLFGLIIPLATISVSINEFLDISYNPWYLLYYSIPTFFGLGLWIFAFYLFFKNKTQYRFSILCIAFVYFFILNYFFFDSNFGSITPDFVYIDNTVNYSFKNIIINLFAFFSIIIIIMNIFRYKKIVRVICISSILTLSALCIKDFFVVLTGYTNEKRIVTIDDIDPELQLSVNNKNIILIMLDSACGPYMPYLLNLKPELKKQFSGFTWYRNTISFGKHTLFGTPGIYGGYEYIPFESNKVKEKKLKKKMNEAISLIPTILSDNNFDSYICDVAYVDFEDKSNPKFFDGIMNTRGFSYHEKFLDIAKTSVLLNDGKKLRKKRCDKLFYYSIMKCAPFALQELIYNNGNYFCWNSKSLVYNTNFLSNFYELFNLPKLFKFTDDDKNKFIIIDNNTCHTDNTLLPYPSFYPTYDYERIADGYIELKGEDDKYVSNTIDMGQFDPQVAAFIQIGNFVDYLRKNNLYDNTRIIIVSDHSFREKPFDIEKLVLTKPAYNKSGNYTRNLKKFMPVLLVKDFYSNDDFQISNDFKTNADTPTLVFKDIVNNPVNPFTGNLVDSSYKKNNNKFYLTCSSFYNPVSKVIKRNEYIYTISDAPWLVVKKDIYNIDELEYDWRDFDPNFK